MIPTLSKSSWIANFDVSGAGDTVIALYTLGLVAGASSQEAAELANHAAGVVVGKLGTATCSPEELVESFSKITATAALILLSRTLLRLLN